jgi:hypothetical protein
MAMDDDDIFAAASRGGLFWMVVAVVVFLAIAGLAFAAQAHDDGRYADSPLKGWFNSLHSGKGPCCSDSDGMTVDDPDWACRPPAVAATTSSNSMANGSTFPTMR